MKPTPEGRKLLRIICVPKATDKSRRVVVSREEIARMKAELRAAK